ncbi:unnamed protein product [Amoebophrya sp. A120]|nr:unnamed protein product [Amoebophrya sp. A120]|eukprot:GSA120T00025262001.1
MITMIKPGLCNPVYRTCSAVVDGACYVFYTCIYVEFAQHYYLHFHFYFYLHRHVHVDMAKNKKRQNISLLLPSRKSFCSLSIPCLNPFEAGRCSARHRLAIGVYAQHRRARAFVIRNAGASAHRVGPMEVLLLHLLAP